MGYDTFLSEQVFDPVVKSRAVGVAKSVSDSEVRNSWTAQFPTQPGYPGYATSNTWVQDVLVDESAVVVREGDGRMYRVPFSVDEDTGDVAFDLDKRQYVRQAWKPVGKSTTDTFLRDPNVVKDWSDAARDSAADYRRQNHPDGGAGAAGGQGGGGKASGYTVGGGKGKEKGVDNLGDDKAPPFKKSERPPGPKVVEVEVGGGSDMDDDDVAAVGKGHNKYRTIRGLYASKSGPSVLE